jgi:hypothetical protein
VVSFTTLPLYPRCTLNAEVPTGHSNLTDTYLERHSNLTDTYLENLVAILRI